MSDNSRLAPYPIDQMFLDRWSPRAFTPTDIAEDELLTMLEAARWAASSYNVQPWRFVYARRNTPAWATLLELLIPFNQSWAQDASALVFFLSKTHSRAPGTDEETASYTHSFDTGAASANFAFQANKLGWFVHGMSGFDVERSHEALKVPDKFRVEAVFAVGRRCSADKLPDFLQEREFPSDRLPLSSLAFEGELGGLA